MSPVGDSRYARQRADAGDQMFDDGVGRTEYIKAYVVGALGVIGLLVSLIGGAEGLNEWSDAGVVGIIFGVEVVLGVAAVIAIAVLLATDAGPLHLVALRVVCMTLAMLPVGMLFLSLPLYGGLVGALVYFGLALILFDMEVYEAAILTFAIFMLNVLGSIALVFVL